MFAVAAADSNALAQTASSLPSPWVSTDIGAPSVAGRATYNQGIFSIAGGGADIGGTSDQFQFVYQPIPGDVDLVARVDRFSLAHRWSKVGVMIRASLTANAANAFAMISGAKGTAFQRRTQSGASTSSSSDRFAASWLRLIRTGTNVTAYSSSDGSTWRTIGSASVALGNTAYVGLAISSHTSGSLATADLSHVSATSLSLPAGQQAIDIGSPAIAGASSYSNGTYAISSASTDIGGTADQFRLVYQAAAGDLDVVARIGSLQKVNSWSKAGVMVRESLNANSRNAMALVSAGNGYSFQWRLDTGGTTAAAATTSGAAPGWVRLKRTGQTFEGFVSTDGATWISIGTETIAMSDTVYVGLAVTSDDPSSATTATVDHWAVAQAAAAPNQPPAVTLTSPASASSYIAPANIAIAASASDPENRLARVDFFANSTRIGSLSTSPFSFTWSAVPAGTYSLTAVAVDLDGASATSPAVTIVVNSANQPPTVSITTPAGGSTFTAPASITISAAASDPENRLARVDFYAGSTLVGSDTTSPYAVTWSSIPAGTYSLTAVAFDADGAKTTSAPVGISVVANQPPSVTLTSPVNGAAFVAPTTIALAANASDPENRLAKVEFYVGTTLVATDTAAPFAASWSVSTTGSYAIKAIAYDLDGGKTSSTVASITVTSAPALVVFQASPDHYTLVNSYRLDVFTSGADPATAKPVAQSDLGKPAPDPTTNDITVDRTTFFAALPSGSYIATVSAVGSGGESRSAPISFMR